MNNMNKNDNNIYNNKATIVTIMKFITIAIMITIKITLTITKIRMTIKQKHKKTCG